MSETRAIHGGAFWSDIDGDMRKLSSVVRADVLDAWFPPAPGVMEIFHTASADLIATSPPEDAEPLGKTLAKFRELRLESILVAGGSSVLIYGSLPYFAIDCARLLTLDPTYGEYLFVAEQNLDLPVFALPLGHPFSAPNLVDRLIAEARPDDLLVLVNPNSPTGTYIPRIEIERLIQGIPEGAKLWIDETYIEYIGPNESAEVLASTKKNVVVSKSMSKVYALSGLRVAYLVSHPDTITTLRRGVPPWSVSLPAMLAGIQALKAARHYAPFYNATEINRTQLATLLTDISWTVREGAINCVLAQPKGRVADIKGIVDRCRVDGVYLRDAGSMGLGGEGWLRIAVRNQWENTRIARVLETQGQI